MASRRAAFAPLSDFNGSAGFDAAPAESSSLHSGQRLAKPGFPGFSSNSSPQTTQTLIGYAMVVIRVKDFIAEATAKSLLSSENIAGTAWHAAPDGNLHRE